MSVYFYYYINKYKIILKNKIFKLNWVQHLDYKFDRLSCKNI